MIAKQQKFIEENDIGANSVNGDKSKFRVISLCPSLFIDLEMFLDGAELEGEEQEQPDEHYASDFILEENSKNQ